MRLYVEEPETNKKIYINRIAKDRRSFVELVGSENIKIDGNIYSVNSVKALPNEMASGTMALGGLLGVVGGVFGLAVGAVIGAAIGKNVEENDRKAAEEFNRSCI